MTKIIAHSSTGMVRMPAAIKRAKLETHDENKLRVPRMLSGSDARKPRSVPANDISTVSHKAAPTVGRMPTSGGNISEPRMPQIAQAAREPLEIEKTEMREHRQQKKAGGGGRASSASQAPLGSRRLEELVADETAARSRRL